MATARKVLCTFFLDSVVDMRLARLALEGDVSKTQFTRDLIQSGLAPFLPDKPLPAELLAGPDTGAVEGRNLVMRSVYLDLQFDDFLRSAAFDLRFSKSDLIRRFLDRELRAL